MHWLQLSLGGLCLIRNQRPVDELNKHGFNISMDCAGKSYKNAVIESSFKITKHEEVNLWDYGTHHDVVIRLPHLIEKVY